MKKFVSACLLTLMLLLPSGKVFSENKSHSSEDSLRAIGKRVELEYLFFTSPAAPEKAKYKIEIARSYEEDANFESALTELDTALRYTSTQELWYEATYEKAFCLFMADSFSLADTIATKLFYVFPDSSLSLRAGFLSVLILNHLENFSDSKKRFVDVLSRNHIDTLGIAKAYLQAQSANYKSIKKTMRLARYLPGSGFFYLNKHSEGVVSLALNLAFLGYAAYSIYLGYYITSVLTGARNVLRFHGGGIKASVSAAQKNNADVRSGVLAGLDRFCVQKIGR